MDIIRIRCLRDHEAGVIFQWSLDEGWDISQHDVVRFIKSQPESFLAAEKQGQLVGCITAFKYGGDKYGMVGMVLVGKDHRKQGIGRRLLEAAREHLDWNTTRNVVLAAREHLIPWYNSVGFTVKGCADIHYSGKPKPSTLKVSDKSLCEIRNVENINLNDLVQYDNNLSLCNREDFWGVILRMKKHNGFVAIRDEKVAGMGFIRKVPSGYAIGPLYADELEIAKMLLFRLIKSCKGISSLHLDCHDQDEQVTALVTSIGLQEEYRLQRLFSQTNVTYDFRRIYAFSDNDISFV